MKNNGANGHKRKPPSGNHHPAHQFKPGNKFGRPKGAVNKVTASVRDVIAALSKKMAPEMERWIMRTSKIDPARAAELYLRMIEYHIPKLVRSELTGKDGADLPTIVQQYIISGKAPTEVRPAIDVRAVKELAQR